MALEVTHLKFKTVPEAGSVAVEACLATEAGAELFTRRDSGRTGTVLSKAQDAPLFY